MWMSGMPRITPMTVAERTMPAMMTMYALCAAASLDLLPPSRNSSTVGSIAASHSAHGSNSGSVALSSASSVVSDENYPNRSAGWQ